MLGKYKIPKNTIVNVGIVCNNYNSKYFENPFEYKPERWLKSK